MLSFPVPGGEHVSVSVPRVGKSVNQRDCCFLWECWTCASVTHVRIKDSQKTWNCFQKVQSLITRGVVHYQHWKALWGSFCGLWCEYWVSDTPNVRLPDLLGKTSCFLARCLIEGRFCFTVYTCYQLNFHTVLVTAVWCIFTPEFISRRSYWAEG